MVATKPIITDTPARFSSGNSEKLVAKTVGIIAPPRNPWSERKTISDSMFQASAQARLMKVKPVADMTKSQRVDNTRDRMPDSGIMMTSAIRYEVWTQLISSALAETPAWISARLLDTIWMSRIAMNMPTTMAKKPIQSRAVTLRGLAAIWAATCASDWAVAITWLPVPPPPPYRRCRPRPAARRPRRGYRRKP